MDFSELAARRFSVRRFQDKPIERNTLCTILRAGHLAPTACNNQPQKILALTEPDAMALLRRCTPSRIAAPAALLVCYDRSRCWVREYDGKCSGEIDVSIVTTHMMLQAAELGVGTTWVMHFIPEAVREEFRLPDTYEPVALLMMGYPAQDAVPSALHTAFRPEDEIVSYNAF